MKIASFVDIEFFGRCCLSNDKHVYQKLTDVRAYLSEVDVVIDNLEAPFKCAKG